MRESYEIFLCRTRIFINFAVERNHHNNIITSDPS